MFLLAGHSGLSAVTGVDSWGAARAGAALDSDVAHGRRGGGSDGGDGSRGARGFRGGGRVV
jgi:hypothetical protein